MTDPTSDDRLRALLDEYGHVLRRAIRRVAGSDAGPELEDIEQEARMRVWRALQQQTTLDKPASYLYKVAVNATLNAIRRHRARREQPWPEEAEGPPPAGAARPTESESPETRAARRQQLAGVRAALAQLAPNRRRAVGLHLQGFTTTEIGRLCGWTEAKARNLAYRGLDDLRSRLRREGEDDD